MRGVGERGGVGGGGMFQKDPRTSFTSVTSTEFALQTLTVSFNSFATLV